MTASATAWNSSTCTRRSTPIAMWWRRLTGCPYGLDPKRRFVSHPEAGGRPRRFAHETHPERF
jgi:hypothetical protein